MNTDLLWKLFLACMEILVAYILGILSRRAINRLALKAENKGVLTFLASFSSIFFKILGLIIALDQLGVSMNLIIGALSALGVGISLALKDNMASVASGLQILLTRPFKVGDHIQIGKYEGQIKSIEMTYTTMITPDNETVVVPNNELITRKLINYSEQVQRRMTIEYPTERQNLGQSQKELLEAAQNCPLVAKDPAPFVRIVSYKTNGAVLELICYTDHSNYWACYDQIMEDIHQQHDQAAGISVTDQRIPKEEAPAASKPARTEKPLQDPAQEDAK